MPFVRVGLAAVEFDAVTEAQAVEYVRDALERGEGGRIITPNVDILRQAAAGGLVARYLDDASLVVADGAPLVWASRLAGTPLPARVAGSDLVWSLARMAAAAHRSLFLLGGRPLALPVSVPAAPHTVPAAPHTVPAGALLGAGMGAAATVSAGAGIRTAVPGTGARTGGRAGAEEPAGAGQPPGARDGARRAADVLVAACPGLRLAGAVSPPYRFDLDPVLADAVRDELVEAKPDLVYVGLGFPRQERVISVLRPYLPGAWFLGCGMAINFVAGDQRRAPRWMRRCGLEWAHRLGSEPRRLARRYLRQDAPYALHLLSGAIRSRYSREYPSG